ncbi:MAG TPA: EamA family transporter RarD [bacterium]|nr:EamA family transporter RarD [bacterium]HPR89116.1 EamA family transporter RarD [bacterium]
MKKGILYSLIALVMWGLFPVYWKWLGGVPALEILSHRMAWSLVFVVFLLLLKKSRLLTVLRRTPRHAAIFLLTASLLSVNWGLYIWAVQTNRVVDASLGYFINPLVSVVLGVVFLQERLRPAHWLAVGLAALGVLYLAVHQAGLPWIALALAFTFAFYGLLRKTAPLNSLEGLAVETALLLPLAAGYLLFLEMHGTAAFGHAGLRTTLLLAVAGPVTALPLLFFAAGVRRIPYSQLAFIQYLSPTLQFLLGAFVYHEPLSVVRLTGFSLVWLATGLYIAVECHRSRCRVDAPPA